MIGMLIAIFIIIFFRINPYSAEMTINDSGIEVFMIAVAIAFIFVVPFGMMLAWGPIQRAEQKSTPYILEMLPKDRFLTITTAYLIAFSLMTFLIVSVFNMHVIKEAFESAREARDREDRVARDILTVRNNLSSLA